MALGFTDLVAKDDRSYDPQKQYSNVTTEYHPTQADAYLAAHKAWMDSADNTEKLTPIGNTPSMLGSGYNGAYVIYRPEKEYKVGDLAIVPSWEGGGHTSIHTITATDPVKGAYTKGTFNSTGDGWTPWDKIHGRALRAFKGKK